MNEQPVQQLRLPPGVISGVGVVRDQNGNIKGKEPTQEKRSGNDSDERRSQRGG